MSTKIKPELSKKNKYHIPKYRYYELKYFCLQYDDYVKRREEVIQNLYSSLSKSVIYPNTFNTYSEQSTNLIDEKMILEHKLEIIDQSAIEADSSIYEYILLGVTKGYTYEQLSMVEGMPCSRDMYYDRYRKFFYILSSKV